MLEIAEQSGVTPPALLKRPELLPELKLAYRVWQELSGSRQQAFSGVGLIPFSEFFLYCFVHGFSRSDTSDLWQVVHTIDVIFVNELSKIQESKVPAK